MSKQLPKTPTLRMRNAGAFVIRNNTPIPEWKSASELAHEIYSAMYEASKSEEKP